MLEKSHHETTITKLGEYVRDSFNKRQTQAEVLRIWKAYADLEQLRRTLDDAQNRLLAEREHWVATVSGVREDLQAEKDYSEYLVRRYFCLRVVHFSEDFDFFLDSEKKTGE